MTTTMIDSTDLSSLHINRTRVRDVDGFIGTVRYIGPVASAKDAAELYVGIEWDDSSRGKHDGSVLCRTTNRIVRHFTASSTGGSFLRPKMVDFGVDLNLSLITSRYVNLDAPLVAPLGILDVAKTASGRDKNIELVGEIQIRKRQQLPMLTDLSLRNMGVARLTPSIAEQDELKRSDLAQTTLDLDLAGNLFSSWEQVWQILALFPNLKHVSFAYNRVMDSSIEHDKIYVRNFPTMTQFNLNYCSIHSFSTVLLVDQTCPNLQELYLVHNQLSDISSVPNLNTTITPEIILDIEEDAEDPTLEIHQPSTLDPFLPSHVFQYLTKLDLTDCNLSCWTMQVRVFRHLPQLSILILNDNPIRKITMADDTDEFITLTELHLGGTQIDSWLAIHRLNFYPQLRNVRFSSTPITNSMGTGEARANIIARLSHVEQVNASIVTTKERIEAERRYVQSVARDMLYLTKQVVQDDSSDDVEKKKQELMNQHPLFDSLFAKHKDSMMTLVENGGESNRSSSSSTHYSTIQVSIRSMATNSITAEPIQKRLPLSLRIGRLKNICLKAFGLDMELQRLHFRCESDPFPTELDDDECTLEYYGVSDGAEILMNEIDVEARDKERLKERELYQQRITEQERCAAALQVRKSKE